MTRGRNRREKVRFSNERDPFLPGCRYELRIDERTAHLAETNVSPSRLDLAFLSLSPKDGSVLSYETSEYRTYPRNQPGRRARVRGQPSPGRRTSSFTSAWPRSGCGKASTASRLEDPFNRPTSRPTPRRSSTAQKVNGVPISGYGYSVQRDRDDRVACCS